jgi:osmotically-inducible protein OsmY
MDNADVRLTYEVTQRLQADARTRDPRITVEVQNGVVIHDGTVGDTEVKQLAADTARDTPGVRDVCNALLMGLEPACSGRRGRVHTARGRALC